MLLVDSNKTDFVLILLIVLKWYWNNLSLSKFLTLLCHFLCYWLWTCGSSSSLQLLLLFILGPLPSSWSSLKSLPSDSPGQDSGFSTIVRRELLWWLAIFSFLMYLQQRFGVKKILMETSVCLVWTKYFTMLKGIWEEQVSSESSSTTY